MDLVFPADTATSKFDTLVDRPLCVFCGRSFSRYTCPSCNAGYCSLKCFRSEAHNQCTEPFYRKAVEDQIQSKPNQSAADRKNMLEMLKRLEAEDSSDDGLKDEHESGGDDDGTGASLRERLAGINIGDLEPGTLWSLLNEKERAEFTAVFQDPQGTKARELLEEHDVDAARFEPWWAVNNIASPAVLNNIAVPLHVFPSGATTASSPNFVFNLFSICLAYAFTTRHLVVSPLALLTKPDSSGDDAVAARNGMARAVPFLADHRSTIIFSSVDQVVTEIWSRIDAISAGGLIRLLEDTLTLLQPSRVDVIPTQPEEGNTPPPTSNLLTLLADLRTLFLTRPLSDRIPRHANERPLTQGEVGLGGHVKDGGDNRITLKLAFYATKASAIPPDGYDQLQAHIRRKITKLEAELQAAANFGSSGSSAAVLVRGADLVVGASSSSKNTETGRKAMIHEIN